MQDYQSSQPSDSTLSTLLAVDTDLAAQEAQLMAQLDSIQQKRQSLKIVIDLFDPVGPAARSADDLVQTLPGPLNEDLNPEIEEQAASFLESSSIAAIAEPEAQATESAQSQKPVKTSSQTRRNKSPRFRKGAKGGRRTRGWQPYMREEFAKMALPEAVLSVLQSQSDKVFAIPEVLEAIFMDEMPQEARSNARDRVSNILSSGVKDNKWYRGKTGRYSHSRSAADAKLSS